MLWGQSCFCLSVRIFIVGVFTVGVLVDVVAIVVCFGSGWLQCGYCQVVLAVGLTQRRR